MNMFEKIVEDLVTIITMLKLVDTSLNYKISKHEIRVSLKLNNHSGFYYISIVYNKHSLNVNKLMKNTSFYSQKHYRDYDSQAKTIVEIKNLLKEEFS